VIVLKLLLESMITLYVLKIKEKLLLAQPVLVEQLLKMVTIALKELLVNLATIHKYPHNHVFLHVLVALLAT
jgi:hypothetical protein